MLNALITVMQLLYSACTYHTVMQLLYAECTYHSNAVTLNISVLKDDTLFHSF